MKFEVINDKNKVVMNTTDVSCIPPKEILHSMAGAGYKFKLNDKLITIKKIIEQIKENAND